jgi:outer membrane protein TolC
MKKFFNVLLILFLIIISINTIKAQESKIYDNSLKGSEFRFPPLQVVIDSALKRSAMVNFRKYNILAKQAVLATERISWTKNLGAQIDANYGNINNFVTNQTGAGSSTALSNSTQLNYMAGFYLKFPLFDGINRKNQIKLAESEVEAARRMEDFEKEEIRKTVITLYQNLILKQRILQIRSRSLGDGRVNQQMVEKEFRNGIVAISEYARINGITSNLEADYETAMAEFIIAKKLLEDMVGFVFELTPSN